MVDRILYVAIPVKNIPHSMNWYSEILKFHKVWHSEEEKLAQVNLPSGQMLFLSETAEDTNANFLKDGVEHSVIGFQTKDIDALYKILNDNNAKVDPIVVDSEGYRFLHFYDPDGNRLTAQCDPAEPKL
ncbi:VOC family protein [Sporosarcina sp. ACRSL]|uniref:VOC family protein n=1 Tax=Sporosarcina sp. ACRSL TaxID=2918215 RepID=UPI001EF45DDC|nr:VOC family protein [Sporosarcina sp. ACRSL]MCG7343497.1 VOC family protein [Sporosarcina sp. ACRSL]